MKVRLQAAQCPRSIRQDVRRIVRRIICASSGELSGQSPGIIRPACGQWTDSVRADAGEWPARCPSPHPVHDQSAASQCPRNVRAASAQRPANHTSNGQATSAQCPSSCREAFHATPANVRTAVGVTAGKRPGNCRWNPRSSSFGGRAASRLASS